MDYQEAKKLGYKYITRDRIGGECAHLTEPKLGDDGLRLRRPDETETVFLDCSM